MPREIIKSKSKLLYVFWWNPSALYKHTFELKVYEDISLNQETVNAPSYIKKYTELPLKLGYCYTL